MTTINLLPWRRWHLMRNSILTLVLQSLLCLLLILYYKQPNLNTLKNRYTQLKKQNHQRQLALVQQQQQQRQKDEIQQQLSAIVYLAKHLPNNSKLTLLKLSKQQLILNGLAKNQRALNTISALSQALPYYTHQQQWQSSYQKQSLHFSLEMQHD